MISKRKIFSGIVLLTSVYFLGRCAPPDLGEVIDYTNTNLQYQELIINNAIDSRRKNNLRYSEKTLGNFSKVLVNEFEQGLPKKVNQVEQLPTSKENNWKRNLSKIRDYVYDTTIGSFE